MTNLQWGIVGLGGIAHSFAESFDQTTSTLTACASRTLETVSYTHLTLPTILLV